jgi:uncharacterized phage-associated protein
MNALPLAGYIVQYCIDRKTPVTNLQLQKILYFVQLQSLKETDFKEPIMEDPQFEAWMFGPVIREVYLTYCLSGAYPIIFQPKDAIVEDSDIPNYVNKVIDLAVKRKPWDLVEISHRDNGAWKKTYQKDHKLPINDDLIIEDAKTLKEKLI